MLVILDPGHGGFNLNGQYVTPGKRGVFQDKNLIVYEGVTNRAIVALAMAKLTAANIRCTAPYLGYDDVSLSTRKAIYNNIHKNNPDAILISVHNNAADSELANGAEIFTTKGQTQSDILAECFGKMFVNVSTRPWRAGGVNKFDKEYDWYIIKQTTMPSVLIEFAFMTNYKEALLLSSTKGIDEAATWIYHSVMHYVNNH